MRVIGIDPGTAATGYGVVEQSPDKKLTYIASGVITPPVKAVLPRRLKVIYDELIRIFERERPAAVVVEDTFMAKNPQAALKLGQARGIVLLAAEQYGAPTYEYSATQVKSAVVGYGGARKEQVQEMVVRLLEGGGGISSKPAALHASDALACAICHFHSVRLPTLSET